MEAALSIENILTVLAWLGAAFVLLPMLVVIAEIVGAMIRGARNTNNAPLQNFPSTVVLIPAHNEEEEVSRTLASLSEDLPPNCRLLCVAHNCSDSTAEVARRMGAEVIEARDVSRGGKPDALKAGLRWLDANPPEVVVVIDADCTVSKGAVRTLATQVHMRQRPVMGAYFFVSSEGCR